MRNLLSIKNLTINFSQENRSVCAVEKVNLDIKENEIVGLVGESGSGKTVSTLAITRILPPNAQIIDGEVVFEGHDLLKFKESRLQAIRGAKIAYIFQEPAMYLNPLINVGSQIAEAVTTHQVKNKSRTLSSGNPRVEYKKARDNLDAKKKAIDLLRQVAIPLPGQVFFDYPHQLSGGMNQRVMIAQALALNPRLLIADEPTTNLDVDTEREILDLILDLQKEVGFSCLFITHNLGLISKICHRVYVMYKGSIVEEGNFKKVFADPQHKHTKALVEAYLRLEENLPDGAANQKNN